MLASSSTQKTAFPKPLRPRSLETGIGGENYSHIQASHKHCWGGSHNNINQSSCYHSPHSCKQISLEQPGNKQFSTEPCKYSISDVYMSFWTHLRINLTIEFSGQTSLILQRQLRGLKMLEPTTKNQKYIPEKLVLHIYKPKNTHLN